jgi:hypothetical protein
LKGITTAAKMADWMFHVHVKSWSNRGVVADFVFALYEISRRGPYWWGEAKALPPGWLQEQAWKNGFPEN